MEERLLSPPADCYLSFAHELREKCHKLEHIKGAAKLERKIFAEIKFLKNLLRKSSKVQESHLKSSNLSHFAAIVHAAENLPGIVDILQAFSCPGKNESLIVDVVAGQGHIWVKVIARKAQALHLVWAGQGQFGERDLLRQSEDYLRSAREHPHIYTTPRVYFLFYNNVTFSMAEALQQRGVHVLGHEVPVDADVEHKLNDLHLVLSDEDDDGGGGEDDEVDGDKIMSASDYLFSARARNKGSSHKENEFTYSSKNTDAAISQRFGPSLSVSNQSKPSVREELCRKEDKLSKADKAMTDNFPFGQSGKETSPIETEIDSDSKHSSSPTISKDVKDSDTTHILQPCLLEPKGSSGSEVTPSSSSDYKLPSMLAARQSDPDSDSKQYCPSDSKPSQSLSKHSSTLKRKDSESGGSSESRASAELETKDSCSANYKPEAKDSCSANYKLLMGELLGVLPDIRNSIVDISEDIINSVSRVNLDITTLITLVSAVTHGHSNFIFTEKILTMQAEEERVSPVLPRLVKFMKGKELFACQSAVEDFRTILTTLGGVGEKQRATELLSRVKVIEDNPSQKALQLKNLGKIKDRSKTIFGTGDSLEAITMTANSGFLRACKGQGVSFAVFVHAARALTEDKEKTATPI